MKLKLVLLCLAVSAVAISAFKKPFKADTYTVDTQSSSIGWLAKKMTGQHNGTIKIKSGTLVFDGSKLTGGNFTMDMTSITNIDLKDNDYRSKLENDLKSENFFSADKQPFSTFQITKVIHAGTDNVTITGNLTIKGITKPLTFPATVKVTGNTVVAFAKGVLVDRTKYDIKYRSKTFFGDIGDKAIEDNFELTINLVAKK